MVTHPFFKIFEWDTAELSNPSGFRHLVGGTFAFRSVISEGCSEYSPNNAANSSGILNFQNTKFDLSDAVPSHLESKVSALTLHLMTSGIAVGNIRMFLVNDSGLRATESVGQDPAFIQFTTSGIWQPNGVLPSGVGTRLSTTVPEFASVRRQDGYGLIRGENDRNASEFIYMNVVIPWGHPLGTYGACGSGVIKVAFTFDYHSNDYIIDFGEVF
jgi:hypothetical protein